MDAKKITAAIGYEPCSHNITTPPSMVLSSFTPKAEVTNMGYKLAGI